MKYNNIITGIFISRPNRFIAQVLAEGKEQTVHVKNTGRCRELLVPGAQVVLERAAGEKRRTAFSLIAVYKGSVLINMDSQIPNKVVAEGLLAGKFAEIGAVDKLKAEVTYASSRFDVYFEQEGRPNFMEVKGVTLEEDGLAMFPDAPTLRGTKHVQEMIKAVHNGYGGYLCFLIQMKGVHSFTPNWRMDPAFAQALRDAQAAGVKILAYDAQVQEEEIVLGQPVTIIL